jgi:DNA-binding NarL/FixJ family response regulator
MTTILLADDHELIREGIASFLGGMSELKICGQCSNSYQIIKNVELMRPQVLIVNLLMRSLNISEIIRVVKKICPSTRIIGLAFYGDDDDARRQPTAEIHSCLTENSTKRDLLEAIKSNSPGKIKTAAEPDFAAGGFLMPSPPPAAHYDYSNVPLTHREHEILNLIVEGQSSKKIAQTLNISTTTVKTHRNHLMEKLAVRNVAGLICESIRLKLVSL